MLYNYITINYHIYLFAVKWYNYISILTMKVYFNASMAGQEKYSKEFKAIIKIIEDLGNDVYSEHISQRNPKDVNNQTTEQHEADFKKARDQIQKSDVMVVEATYPSIGVGHTMTIALEMHKGVLVLYQNTPHGLLVGDPNRLLTLKKYSLKDIEELKSVIETFLEKANKRLLNKRFNLMIDETEDEYLEWVSQKRGISRADYIRQLIDEDLKNDNDYNRIS